MNRNKYDLEAKELAKKEKTRKNKMKLQNTVDVMEIMTNLRKEWKMY